MKKKVLALALTLAMLASLVTVPAAALGNKTFPDAVGHWAEESILRWSRCGLVKGDELGNVNPNKPLRRCEMATILSDMLGLRKAAPISTFKDIDGSEWYARAILRCAAAGIMEGSNSMSYPEDYITREEAIVMFGRALGVQPNDDPDLSQFLDGDQVSGWAAPYMATLTELGILGGMGDGTVAPHANINRAGAFTLMDKAIAVYANAPGTYQSKNANGFVVINANDRDGGDVIVTGKANGVLVAVGASNAVRLRDLEAENVIVNGAGDMTVTGKSALGALAVNNELAVTVEADAAVEKLEVKAEKAAVTNAGTVTTLRCAEVSTVKNAGKVGELVADAAAAVTNTGTVDKLVANAALTVDNTKGTVKNAEINMGGVVMDGPPQQMTVAPGVVRPANSSGRPISATGSFSGGGGGGGGSRPSTPTVSVTGVSLDPIGWEMNVGDTKLLTATVEPANATNKTVTWTSSNTDVATVSGGVVTAVAQGEAVITAAAGGKTAQCKITVRAKDCDDPIVLKGVAFDKETLKLVEGDEGALKLFLDPANTTVDVDAVWASSDTDVVTVDQTGKLTAVAPGTAEITATVTVTTPETPETPDNPDNPGGTTDPTDPDNPGGTTDPTDPDTPGGTTDPTDPDNPGGTTDPTTPTQPENPDAGTDTQAETADNVETFTAKCVVTVTAKPVEMVAVTGVTLNKSELTLEAGKAETLTPTVAPANATDKTVTWKSSEESVATVVDGVVTAVAQGTATITVTTKDGGFTATCAVTVTAKTPVAVTGVTLNKDELTLEAGKAETLTPTVAPADATDKTVTWTSSDKTVATVADGVVTAVAEGTATITVTTTNGGFTATCTVTVTAAAPKVQHTVTVTEELVGGAVTADKTGTVAGGETVTLTVTPDAQKETTMPYVVKSVTVNDGTEDTVLTPNEEGAYTFTTATDAPKNYTVTAEFVQPILEAELFISQNQPSLEKMIVYGYPKDDVTAAQLAETPWLFLGLKTADGHTGAKSKIKLMANDAKVDLTDIAWGATLCNKWCSAYINTKNAADLHDKVDELKLTEEHIAFVLTFEFEGASYTLRCTYNKPVPETPETPAQ